MIATNKNVIYQILNTYNNKYYIGSASYFNARKADHLSGLRRNTHHNDHLQNSFNKYGENVFKFSILEFCNKENLKEREQWWLDNTRCLNDKYGYNIAKDTIATWKDKKMTQETKDKISKAHKGKPRKYAKISKECLEGLSIWKIKNGGGPMKGKPSPKPHLYKTVYQYTKELVLINKYISVTEASIKTNITKSLISHNCLEKTKTCKGFIFKYNKV